MLDVSGLHKRYDEVVALDGLSLTAHPGRLLGFLGPNGSGKTTTMRAVFGLVHLDAGTATWKGGPIDAQVRLRFGYMPEQRGLYPQMAIGRQLTFLGRMHGMEVREARDASLAWLDRLGLADRADAPLSELSHGNQQRVQLAAALVHDPELLVLDEPFSGLDPIGVQDMSAILHERAAAGTAVVFSSHQLELVEELCDDVVIVATGRDRLRGTLEEARAAATYRNVEVRLAGGMPVTPPPGAELLDARGGVVRLRVPIDTDVRALLEGLPSDVPIEHLAFTPPTLTEVFRDVVGATVEELEADHVDHEGRAGSSEASPAEVGR